MYRNLAFILSFAALLLLNNFTYSQIQSETPYYDSTQYTTGLQDKIFIFYKLVETASDTIGQLSAVDPNGCETCDFAWYSFSYSDTVFSSTPFATGNNVTDLAPGGYKVEISNSTGYDTSFVAWIFINHLEIGIEGKDTEGKVDGDCNFLDLKGYITSPESFEYYDFTSKRFRLLTNTHTILWTHDSDNSDADLTDKDKINPSVSRPPYFDVTYTMNVYDKYKYASGPVTDDAFYESEIPLSIIDTAKLEIKGSRFDDTFEPNSSEGFSAPAIAHFENDSKNADSYQWILVDSVPFARDPNYLVKTSSQDTIIEYIYYYPRTYTAKLVAYNGRCTDTSEVEIVIKESKLDIPTLVCPDKEYFFMFDYESIKSLHVLIFDRWGKKVYEFEGDINNWNKGKGWDGTIKDSGRKASPGMYFYVIEGRGWDNEKYEFPNDDKSNTGNTGGQTQDGTDNLDNTTTGTARGSFYLFREK